MNDNAESLLARLPQPSRRSDRELRTRVLSAVDQELAAVRQRRRLARAGWATAALLILGVGMNYWVMQTGRERFAALSGSREAPRTYFASNGEAIASYCALLQQASEESETLLRNPRHEKVEKNPPVDGDRHGNDDRPSSHNDRRLLLDARKTA